MTTAQQDTEITLGTGRMLAIFFTFVLVCAFFFSIGFSLGRRTTIAGVGTLGIPHPGTPATVVRPSAAKNDPPQSTPQSGDFSFYKAVGEKNANAALAPQDSKTPAAAATTPASTTATPTPSAEAPSKPATDGATAAASSAGYYVQVAAVSRQEPGVVVGARLGSPLVLGVGPGEAFLASDPSALAGFAEKVIYLDDGQVCVLTAESWRIAVKALRFGMAGAVLVFRRNGIVAADPAIVNGAMTAEIRPFRIAVR